MEENNENEGQGGVMANQIRGGHGKPVFSGGENERQGGKPFNALANPSTLWQTL